MGTVTDRYGRGGQTAFAMNYTAANTTQHGQDAPTGSLNQKVNDINAQSPAGVIAARNYDMMMLL